MITRINIIWLLISACLVFSCRLTAQQTNPFDIIQSQSTSSIATDLKPIAADSTFEKNEDAVSEDINVANALQTIVVQQPVVQQPDSFVSGPEPSINNNNPFSIKKTSGVVKSTSTQEVVPFESELITEVEESSIAEPIDNTSWFSRLKPRTTISTNIDYSLNFIFWILIVSLLILAVVINLKRKSFLNLYRAITNDNYLKLLQREEHNGSTFFFLLLYFLFFLNASLFIYQYTISKYEISGYKIFLSIFVALLGVYIVRLISNFLLRVIFPIEKETKQFNFTIIMFNIIVGLLLIPVNILTAYAPFGGIMLYIGLGIILIFYTLRQIRGLFIASRAKGLSYFHFFIYLCSFEVAPIIWIISILKN